MKNLCLILRCKSSCIIILLLFAIAPALHAQWSGTPDIYYNGGNVGINESAPQSRLSVNGSIRITSNSPIPTTGKGLELLYQSSPDLGIIGPADRSTSTRLPMSLRASTFDFTGGSVGIGTNVPGRLLSLENSSSSTTFNGNSIFRIGNANAANSGVTMAMTFSRPSSDVGTMQDIASIEAKAGGTTTAAGQSGNLLFGTMNTGTLAEVWRMSSAGVLQSNGAQTIQTSTGNLTLATAAGNGNINLTPHGTGNVGIGTTSPSALLHIDQNNSSVGLYITGGASGIDIARFRRDVGSTGIVGVNSNGSNPQIYMDNENGGVWSIGNKASNNNLLIAANSSVGTNDRIVITTAGDMGIGTTSTTISGTSLSNLVIGSGSTSYGAVINASGSNDGAYSFATAGTLSGRIIYHNSSDKLGFAVGGTTEHLTINSTGNVGIGTTSPSSSYRLDVCGNVRAKKVKVETGWCDYVFEDTYKLMSIKELESYIDKHHHLPEIPAEKEIVKDGLDIGDMQAMQMKKIEEMTLYIIALQKQVDVLQSKMNELNRKN